MPHFINKSKSAATIVIILLTIMPMIMVAQGQYTQSTGLNFTNLQSGASEPLPSGITPDATFQTIPYISFRPNPIGLNQPLLVNLWLEPATHVTHYFSNAFQVVFVTKPDGTKDTVGPISSFQGDTSAYFNYVVDQTGTWQVQFNFLGGYFPAGNYTIKGGQYSGTLGIDRIAQFPNSSYYAPSSTGVYNFTVQTDQVASWPSSSLPTDYWTRPISPDNREWWTIAGGYPATGILGGGTDWPANTNMYMSNYGYIPYVQAPNSAHILWRRQTTISGLIGGILGTAL